MSSLRKKHKSFADYKAEAASWITLATGEYYPDVLRDACNLYSPVLATFGKLLERSESSVRLFMQIVEVPNGWMRVQLGRVFRRYVSPQTPVEMLKHKRNAEEICKQFGKRFRPIQTVHASYKKRPVPDEALCALLWEYKARGQKGYDLTERFFSLVRAHLPDKHIIGPERAGKDILLGNVFEGYPNPTRPVDFVIFATNRKDVAAIGLARYDSDRGGAQEDDRTGGYNNCADEILNFAATKRLNVRVIFVNDGPGLLLGSMWDDYAKLEARWPGKIMVTTLRMIPERLTNESLSS
jgi:hypothetical protein